MIEADGGMDAGSMDAGSDAGLRACPMLSYAVNNEPSVVLPLTIAYPAFSDAGVSGQGANASAVGYSMSLVHLDGGTSLQFGVDNSDVGQGVPWDDDAGVLTDGLVKAWAIDVVGASTEMITLTFDTPVTGFRMAITDLDFTTETVLVEAFATSVGGTAISLTDHPLSAPVAYPELAQGSVHSGNDAYVVDQTKVQALGGGRYGSLVSGGISDRTGTVLFAYGATQSVQRLEITYTGNGTGVWIAGLVFNDMCGP